jgi:2-polyprenyl-3-methyl-5-hydroxy-6-metoxy-1,4-benzoquinol methylase
MGEKKTREWYNEFLSKVGIYIFNVGPHMWRAKAMAPMIEKCRPMHIFEFAAGGTTLAWHVLELLKDIEYTWSDFAAPALKGAETLATMKNVHVQDIDIDANYAVVPWEKYDLCICVSMEHLEHDVEILQAMKKGTVVFLSIPEIDAADHIRQLDSDVKIYERYGKTITIHEIRPVQAGKLLFRIVAGTRK